MQRHRTEFAVTMRTLEDHLPWRPATVLDVGGGPGRYAIALAQRGYRGALLDLSRGNLDLARTKAREAGVELTAVLHGDARQLPFPPHTPYDAVLLMGPLYHLLSAEARHKALSEARRVLKPEGVVAGRREG